MSGTVDPLADAISLLDDIDGMSFGKVSSALDSLQSHLLLAKSNADKSAATIEALVWALEKINAACDNADTFDAIQEVKEIVGSTLSLARGEA